MFEESFKDCSICYFPPNRKEMPHWLNKESLGIISDLIPNEDFIGFLRKPIIVESSNEENKQWLLDVVIDSLIDVEYLEKDPNLSDKNVRLIDEGHRINTVRTNLEEKVQFKQSKKNIEIILKKLLENENITLELNNRSLQRYRLCIADRNTVIIPSLDHLSSGQSVLFNLFATIIRYADKGDINKSTKLEEIRGIVIIDEIELHLHTDLQHNVLPNLLRLFPKVQFIIATHSPLFLLGMEKVYGEHKFQIIEMPKGKSISTERFSEFKKSLEFLKATKTFEEEMQARVQNILSSSNKPLILLEGKTDLIYINKALKVLGRDDILEKIDIDQVGICTKSGSKNSGSSALESIEKFYCNNNRFLKNKLLLLYDCDVNKKRKNEGNLFVESINKVENDCAFPVGIENLLPISLLQMDYYLQNQSRFYNISEKDKGFQRVTIKELNKTEFCKWVCEERAIANDFKNFDSVIEIFERFMETAQI